MSSQVYNDLWISSEVVVFSESAQQPMSTQVYDDLQIILPLVGRELGVTQWDASDLLITSLRSSYDTGITSLALEQITMFDFDLIYAESDVKAANIFDSDDDYHPSLSSPNTRTPKYFSMPPTSWNSSHNVTF
ncbi:hypothetical protein R1flu_018155 [Riccia fluitans]|uniref:Uncharacterized protein n=1 Tax=Riccia fluitans TaxID=41844 RepID=A0ABD1ZEZ9_9MARC